MKSRSHRLPTISDTPDDWVDESWTVDCVCGVNFDDGEEMVNCDECGVWVHTRCSRYVKGEKLFACDKCKTKRLRNENEETEVAQLLVELPTKTLRMDNPVLSCPPPNPLQLWTEIPLEEKVHVQGIPGGDPGLFRGFSSVFGPELWKCTGYVPKKFNFQYREFPCWDKGQEDGNKCKEDLGNPASKGADLLFSMSKENALPGPASVLAGLKSQLDGGRGAFGMVASAMDMKKQVVENSEAKRLHSGGKKERSLMKPIVIHSVKRKKEDSRAFKDFSDKKKAKALDKDQELHKRGVHSSKSVSIMSSDARLSEPSEGKSPKVVKTDIQSCQLGNSRADVHTVPKSESCHDMENNVGIANNTQLFSGQPSENICSNDSRNNSSKEANSMEQKDRHEVPMLEEISLQTEDSMADSLRQNDTRTAPMKVEVGRDAIDGMVDNGRSHPCRSNEPQVHMDDQENAAPAIKGHQSFQESNVEPLAGSLRHVEVKPCEVSHPVENSSFKSLPAIDVKLDGLKVPDQNVGISDLISASGEVKDDAISGSLSRDLKVPTVEKRTTLVNCQTDEPDESPSDPCRPKSYLMGSESSVVARKNSSEFKHGSGPCDGLSKSHGTIPTPGAPNLRKVAVSSVGKNPSAGKTSSISSAVGLTKASVPDKVRHLGTENRNSMAKHKEICDNNHNSKKDNTSSDAPRDGDERERPKKIAKELPKSLSTTALKSSNLSKFSHAAVSKKNSSDSRVPVSQSSSKTSSVQKTSGTPESGDSANSLQGNGGLHSQNRGASSGSCLRAEKLNQSNYQSAPKNNPPSVHPPAPTNATAGLSDEELALLLHQELNSSPRVPRVPRMRHAGSLPQLASPTATSMLVKRASSSGGKDNSLISRKRNKDMVKDVASNSRERDDGAKKVDRVPSLANSRRHEPVETGLVKVAQCAESSIPPASTTVSGGPSSSAEANEQIMSSRNSPQNGSDDDNGPLGRASHRTLPGLIAEIMSTGKRMTYEELCNAVLPHWPNLRKHNGERYAYSSHSQAVLDCLRNRSEWSRLVDRGPKTNAGRKRRKPEADPQSHESEGNDYTSSKDRSTKEADSKSLESQSHRDEFPKGKRKARKRRRLALQGRGIKDVRRRRKAEVVSDDIDSSSTSSSSSSSSSSSEDSMFSNEEVQEGTSVVNEACASSDETGAIS